MNEDIIIAILGILIGIALTAISIQNKPITVSAAITKQYDQEKAKCEQDLPRNQQCTFKWEFVK